VDAEACAMMPTWTDVRNLAKTGGHIQATGSPKLRPDTPKSGILVHPGRGLRCE
jgi:hypothetical protein